MSRDIKKILISTMPRSGTVFLFNFIAELFEYKKVEPTFSTDSWPKPPQWDPYKSDESYLSLKNGEVLCAHYVLNEKIRQLICQDDLLTIYRYRDPRDVAVSAAMYIKYALTEHPLHSLLADMSDTDAIIFILSGGVVPTGQKAAEYINHGGIQYFCANAIDWLNEKNIAVIRYESLMSDPVSTLESALGMVNVNVQRPLIQSVSDRLTFNSFSGGRTKGVEQKSAHFRKGIVGDYINYFRPLHKAICKARIGGSLIELGYETDLLW